mmetsp:Transcript_46964/g.102152  ORF Transcript_46964/g.102152 Transcript_46964/m.102152 type:complete len:148 (+) Transcript_46964:71-514(+)|eukprot:CAMPEP_0170620146 /NCGR_PEP_ID=MMETSP0224-20130122/27901_1 /TAXON_ID=285029 /ORGANISM="Togula jolla, Strain CCCM 725" /LENGTH=147 /DNA_ID=CAMNT_0010946297 /DNA_START=48 /DNA_END=491 /DNA_ORIENTATION=+
MALLPARLAIFGILLGVVCQAQAKGDASEEGKSCTAKSCDKDGHCEERPCMMLDTEGSGSPAARGRIISCQGCKLNYLHDVRRWLREEQRWKEWQNIDVRWVNGHNPDLVVMDEQGNEKERVDLSQFSYGQLPEMLRQKGFRMKGEY